MIKKDLAAFEKYCNGIRPTEYIFNSENQSNSGSSLRIQTEFRFNSMIVRPNRILFRGESGYLCFNNVDHVEVLTSSKPIGTFFQIICIEKGENKRHTYLMLAE